MLREFLLLQREAILEIDQEMEEDLKDRDSAQEEKLGTVEEDSETEIQEIEEKEAREKDFLIEGIDLNQAVEIPNLLEDSQEAMKKEETDEDFQTGQDITDHLHSTGNSESEETGKKGDLIV